MKTNHINNTLIILLFRSIFSCSDQGITLPGRVTNVTIPLSNSRVRVKANPDFVITDANGNFELNRLETQDTLIVTAWHEGFYINSVIVKSVEDTLEIILKPYPNKDNPSYQWINPDPDSLVKSNCGNCHKEKIYKQTKS